MPLSVNSTFFLSDTGGKYNPSGSHLMVCIAVDAKRDTAVIVPIVTKYDYSDSSCVLNVGDHPFIKHESCAAYDFAQVVPLSEISSKIDNRKMRLQAPVNADVLKRLQVGFVISDETIPWVFEAGNGPALTVWLKHQGYIS